MSSLFITQKKGVAFALWFNVSAVTRCFQEDGGIGGSMTCFSVFFSLAVARPTIRDGHSSRETLSIHLLANEMKINSLSAAHTILNFLIRLSFVFLPGAKIKSVQKCWKKTL